MQNDHIRTLNILLYTSEFGGQRKHPNNPACVKSVRVFIMLKLDTTRKKKSVDIYTHIPVTLPLYSKYCTSLVGIHSH